MVKPPVQVFGLEGRYACALFSAASKQKSLDAVEKDLIALQTSMQSNPNFRDMLINPTIKRSLKASALKDAAKTINWAPATVNLLELMAENGRLKKLNTVINHYRLIMSAHRGEVICEVTTAKPLDNSQRKDLENSLKVSKCFF
jgi:F-type H+-transporting ATPase subunit O